MGLVVWDWLKGWNIEPTRFHGPNVVRCKIVSGGKWTLLISAYLLTPTLEHLPDLEEDIT